MLFSNYEITHSFSVYQYNARRLMGSRILESAAAVYCNQIMLADQFYSNSAQNTSVTSIIRSRYIE